MRRAISSTRDAFGDHLPITALVDKKTFRSEKKCVVVTCLLFFVSFKALFMALIFFSTCRTRLLELLKDELHVNVIFSKTTLPHKPAKMGE